MVHPGDLVRLRFIDAGASTIFHVKMPNTNMLMVSADGNDIKPYRVKRFTIAPGETYDVIVQISHNRPYIIYAGSIAKKGAAYGALITQANQSVAYQNVKPFPNPKPITMMGHHKMGADHSAHMKMKQKTPMSSKTEYDALESKNKTNNPNKPFHIIQMTLSGFMDRYIWFLNGLPEYKAKPIMIKHGERYRLIFVNKTMMDHPMHIHGHWFILRNGHGAYDPLLHTINVPPGATLVADFDADTKGQWFFHCHQLYHMRAGMANIFRYTLDSAKPDYDPYLNLSGHKPPGLFFATHLDLNADFFNDFYEGSFLSLMGSNFVEYIFEAHRVLDLNGLIHIIERTSRFSDLETFSRNLSNIGFKLLNTDKIGKFTHIFGIKSILYTNK